MSKYIKYLVALISFSLAPYTLYKIYIIAEHKDAVRALWGQTSFSIFGFLVSLGGLMLAGLFLFLGIKLVASARKS